MELHKYQIVQHYLASLLFTTFKPISIKGSKRIKPLSFVIHLLRLFPE